MPLAGSAGAQSTGSIKQTQSGLVASDSMTTGNTAGWTFGVSTSATGNQYNYYEDSQGLHLGVQSPSSGSWINYNAVSPFMSASLFHAVLTNPYPTSTDGVFNPGFYIGGSDYNSIIGCVGWSDPTGYYWALQTSTDAGSTWATLWQAGPSTLSNTVDCTVVTNGSNQLTVYVGGSAVFSSASMTLSMTAPFRVFFQDDSSSATMRYTTFYNYYASTSDVVTVTSAPSGDSAQLVDASNNVLASAKVATNGDAFLPVGMYAMPVTAYLKVLDPSGALVASTSAPVPIYGGDVYAVTAPTLDSTSTTLSPSPASATTGGTVTLTATVTDSGASPSSPTGSVSWSDGGAGGSFSQSTCTLSSSSSSASACQTVYTAPSTAATVTISGSYFGDPGHSSSSGSASLTVSAPALHSTAMGVSPNPSSVTAGGSMTFTASVTDIASSPTVPSGTISWSDGGKGGSFSSPTCSLQSAGAATSSCQVTYTAPSAAGSVTITASYSGDPIHSTSSGTSSLSVNAAVTYSIAKASSGLVLFDPLNDVTMSQQQLQAQGRYTYGGDAVAENAPYSFSEDSNGLHIGVQAPAYPPGTYAGFYAADLNFNQGQVFHAVMTVPSRTIPSGFYNVGLYVQTGNGYIDYIFCGSVTSSSGTFWGASIATSNNTNSAASYQSLWFDSSANQALTRSCTIVTNGSSMLKVYVDNVLVYSNSALNMQFARPLQTYLEVESSYSGAVLSGTFTDFYVTTTTAITLSNIPGGATSVKLVDQSGNTLATSPVTNGVATMDIGQDTFPLSAKIIVQRADGSTLVSSVVLALWGGDTYTVASS